MLDFDLYVLLLVFQLSWCMILLSLLNIELGNEFRTPFGLYLEEVEENFANLGFWLYCFFLAILLLAV